jgi:hypothetical protein
VRYPALAEKTGIHVKTIHQKFGSKGNPTAANLFNIAARQPEHEVVDRRWWRKSGLIAANRRDDLDYSK